MSAPDPGGIIGLRDVYDVVMRLDAKMDAQAVTLATQELRITRLEEHQRKHADEHAEADAGRSSRRWDVWVAAITAGFALIVAGWDKVVAFLHSLAA